MSQWYHKIATKPVDLVALADALAYFDNEYAEAQKELKVKGNRIDSVSSNLPGIVEHRFGQLQELEAILQFIEITADKAQATAKQNLMQTSNRTLSDRQADAYAKVDKDVFDLRLLQIEISLVRNKFLSITKGLEYLHFQLGHITRLRAAGLDDATL